MTTCETPENPKTRGARIIDAGIELRYPPCDQRLIDLFITIQIATTALSWSDVRAFRMETMIEFSPGESEALLKASSAYAGALQEYNGQARPAPYGYDEERRQRVGEQIKAGFQEMRDGGR